MKHQHKEIIARQLIGELPTRDGRYASPAEVQSYIKTLDRFDAYLLRDTITTLPKEEGEPQGSRDLTRDEVRHMITQWIDTLQAERPVRVDAPSYPVRVDYAQALYAANCLKERVDHIEARLVKNPRTPNASQLKSEVGCLREVRAKLESVIDQHDHKMHAQIRELDEIELCSHKQAESLQPN